MRDLNHCVADVGRCIPWNVEVDDIVAQKLDKVETPLEVWTVDGKDVWREDIDDLLWGKRREVERMQVESRRHFLWLVDGMGEGFCWGEVFLKEDEGEAISLGSKPNERGQVGRAV